MFSFSRLFKKKAVDYRSFDVSSLLDLVYRGNSSVIEMENLQWTAPDGNKWCGAKFVFVSLQSANEAKQIILQSFPFIAVEINSTVRPPILLTRWPIRDYLHGGLK